MSWKLEGGKGWQLFCKKKKRIGNDLLRVIPTVNDYSGGHHPQPPTEPSQVTCRPRDFCTSWVVTPSSSMVWKPGETKDPQVPGGHKEYSVYRSKLGRSWAAKKTEGPFIFPMGPCPTAPQSRRFLHIPRGQKTGTSTFLLGAPPLLECMTSLD